MANELNLTEFDYSLRSNHGTYMHNQVASLQILVGDRDGAIDTLNHYFSNQYLDQIDGTGEQVRNIVDIFATTAVFNV